MQITKAFQTLFYLATAVSAVPIPWSESLLEDVNSLRASGLSESEIAHRFPRALFYPNPTNPTHEITLYSPPDLRRPTTSSNPNPSSKSSKSLLSTFLRKLSSPITSMRSWTCDDDDDMGDVGDGSEEGWRWELVKEEDRRLGRGRFKEGVGRRGEEMGRKEDLI